METELKGVKEETRDQEAEAEGWRPKEGSNKMTAQRAAGLSAARQQVWWNQCEERMQWEVAERDGLSPVSLMRVAPHEGSQELGERPER